MRYAMLYLLLLLCSLFGRAQQVLEIVKEKPFTYKKYELYTNEKIEYKLKGDSRYRKDIILGMSNDRLLLRNDSIISFSNLKAIRIRKPSHLLKTLQFVSFVGGVGYLGLNLINNALLEAEFKVDRKAMYIAGGGIAGGIIIKLIRVKHVRIGSKTSLKVIELGYQDLGK